MPNTRRRTKSPLPGGPLLTGQIALVTGGGSGIGRGIALALADAGASVGILYHSDKKSAGAVVSEIRKGGTQADAWQGNVSDEASVESVFRSFIERFGRLDILVNNAGIQMDAPFAEMTLRQWNAVIGVNLTGQFLCARAAVRQFMTQKSGRMLSAARGTIIHISSVHETIPWAGHANYAASKGGVRALMETLAQEVAGARIRVNSIAPGAIKTSINRRAWNTPASERELLKKIPYGRVGDPGDVGRVAVWLASDQSDYVTGETIFIDGGMTLYPAFRTGG